MHLAHQGPGEQIAMNNQTLADLARYLERRLGRHVADQTGTTNHFDIKLFVQPQGAESVEDALKRSVLDSLGLELVPTNTPTEMLLVQKTGAH